MQSDLPIHGIGIEGYRSFGSEMQYLGPFDKINLLIGPNNCGKSNILRFLWRHWRPIMQGEAPKFGFNDFYGRGLHNQLISIELLLPRTGGVLQNLLARNQIPKDLEDLVFDQEPLLRLEKQMVAVPIDEFGVKPTNFIPRKRRLMEELVKDLEIHKTPAWTYARANFFPKNSATSGTGANDPYQCLGLLFSTASPVSVNSADVPEVLFMSAVRELQHDLDKNDLTSDPNEQWTGATCIDQLARLQNPGGDLLDANKLHERRDTFEQFKDFVRDVLDQPKLEIQVNYEKDGLLFDFPYGVIPHSSLGTGLHQVVMMAAATAIFDNRIWCLEEPELYLHPTWQKRLLRRLRSTSNQIFIATHSAALIDSGLAKVFQFEHDGRQTRCKSVVTDQEIFGTCALLGLRPSDLLQSECVIWVEGPSDRLYINAWLRAFDPELLENNHYSIMFYGGSLRAHLSATDTNGDLAESDISDVDEDLIKLCQIARRSVFVIDRDKVSSVANGTKNSKTRLIDEFDSNPQLGFTWITAGRTIENYILPSTFLEICQPIVGEDALLPSMIDPLEWNIAHVRHIRATGDNKGKPVDTCPGKNKVAFAKCFAEVEAPLKKTCHGSVFEYLEKLSTHIREWSGMPVRNPRPRLRLFV